MPTWAVVLVGITAGVASGLLGTLISTAHERRAEFRTRQLDAAADFLQGSEAVLRAIRRRKQGGETFAQRADKADELWDDLVYKVNMLQLLFGEKGIPTLYARLAAGALGIAIRSLRDRAEASDDEKDAAHSGLKQAIQAVNDRLSSFTRSSTDAVSDGWARRRFRPRKAADYPRRQSKMSCPDPSHVRRVQYESQVRRSRSCRSG
jgi:hypothetical protein